MVAPGLLRETRTVWLLHAGMRLWQQHIEETKLCVEKERFTEKFVSVPSEIVEFSACEDDFL
jgi:hypothetical protein